MSGRDVYPNDMQDEPLDAKVAAFLEEVQATHSSPPLPEPGPELAALFSSGVTVNEVAVPATGSEADGPATQATGLGNPTRGRQMLKSVFASMAGKAAAAFVGGLVAVGGLAAAGALPGGMQLVASNVAESVGVGIPTGDGSNVINAQSHTATPTVGVGKGKKVNPGDPLPPPATTAAEAAHIHAFDVACGNHGAYVSHVARFGEEPACATAVRNGQTPNPAIRAQKGADRAGEVESKGEGENEDEQSPEAKEAKERAKAERQAAKERADAERDAAGARAEAEREAGREKADAGRAAGRDRAKAERDAAKGERDAAKGERRGGPGRR